MNIKLLCTSIAVMGLFTACTTKQTEYKTTEIQAKTEQKQIVLEKKVIEPKIEVIEAKKYNLSNNELKFLEILKTDKYSSLCANSSDYTNILSMEDTKNKSIKIQELFYTYTKNLSNSCINQEAFQKKLRSGYYKKRNQDYEVYNVDINKDELLEKFKAQSNSIESILQAYIPKHPQFFKLIDALNDDSLSQSKKNKIKLNIERLKLLKYGGSNNFIQLNVPSHDFTFYENSKVTKQFGTVVGSAEHQTPIISDNLDYFIINPTWNIPDSIAKKVIKKALKDRNYLRKRNIVVRKTYDLNSKKINFRSIKWKPYLKDSVKWIPYKFIQLPSRTNGMGRMKYIFPNKYAVYMHDTIGTWRFKTNKPSLRFVSHGCIRLEHPVSLMKYISTNYTAKSYASVKKLYDSQRTHTIRLNKKLPVHLTYLTTQVKNGKVRFYSDIYGYDKIQKLNF